MKNKYRATFAWLCLTILMGAQQTSCMRRRAVASTPESRYYNNNSKVLSALIIAPALLVLIERARKAYHSSQHKKFVKYKPTGKHRAYFNNLIENCDLNPDNITLAYHYLSNGLCNHCNDLIMIDPTLWQGLEDDADAIQACQDIERNILPSVPDDIKKMDDVIRAHLTEKVQKYAFLHELGHIKSQTIKRTIVYPYIKHFIATAFTIVPSFAVYCKYGSRSYTNNLIAGFVGLASTLGFEWFASDILYANEEEEAKNFSIAQSSPDEIRAVADYLEACEKATNSNLEEHTIAELREAAQKKESANS